MDTGEPNCDFPNGQVIATGTFEPTVSDSSANLDVDPPGTLDCQAEFYAAGGGTLETGGDPTGSTTIVCHAFGSELFNGFVIDFLYRPMENTSYPLGFPSLIPAGITATYNGEALLTYDEGPICDTLQDKAKQCTAEGGGGTLEVGTVDGDNFEFSIVDASFSPVDGGTNYLGTGTFTLAGEGSADLVEK